jgi:hypothetical protein
MAALGCAGSIVRGQVNVGREDTTRDVTAVLELIVIVASARPGKTADISRTKAKIRVIAIAPVYREAQHSSKPGDGHS